MFHSNEHEPIHVHAFYNDADIKISSFIRKGEIYRTTYKAIHGKSPNNKLKQLKKLIGHYKFEILQLWFEFFVLKKDISPKKINKKL